MTEQEREELKDIINWNNWDRIVEQTKKDIAERMKDYMEPEKEKLCYLYNNQGELIRTFKTKSELAEYLNATNSTIRNYLKREWNYNGYLLSFEKMRQDIAFAIYNYNKRHGFVYIQGETKKRTPVYCYMADGTLAGAYETQYKWSIAYNKSNAFIKDGDRIVNERLVSKNRYDEKTAREMYIKVLEREPNFLCLYVYKDGLPILENAKPRHIIELTNTNHHTIYRNFALHPYFYINGYVVSKEPLTQLEAFEIALKGNNFKKSKK